MRQVEWPFNFVKGVNQATQLAAYRLVNSRELHPIELHCKPRLRAYRPGDCLHIDRPDLGLDTDAIVLAREFDPATMTVKLTLMGETPAKHAYALGQSGTAPDTPALGQTPQERDETASSGSLQSEVTGTLIATSYTTDFTPLDGLIDADATGSPITLTIETHNRTYADKGAVSVAGAVLDEDENGDPLVVTLGGGPTKWYHVAYDDPDRVGGAVNYVAYLTSEAAATSGANPARHYVGSVAMPNAGGSSSGGGSTPPGWDPDPWRDNEL